MTNIHDLEERVASLEEYVNALMDFATKPTVSLGRPDVKGSKELLYDARAAHEAVKAAQGK